jgi:hypothetical protein
MSKSKDESMIVATKQEDSLQNLFDKAQILIDKKMVPSSIKKPEEVVSIIQIGESLGMNPTTALNSIDLIQGAIALKAKVIPGLLAKGGVAIQVLKDYQPVIEQKKVPKFSINKDTKKKEFIFDDDNNPVFFTNPDGSFMIKEEIVDYVTEVRFKRYFPNIGLVENDVEFKWSDAINAQWDSKPNWQKMPKYMMMARCITRGARIAASDIIGGLYDDLEVSEMKNINVQVTED